MERGLPARNESSGQDAHTPFTNALIAVLALFLTCPLYAQSGNTAEPPTPGYFDFLFTTRVFKLPLFDYGTAGAARFFGSQTLRNGSHLTAWFSSGFPNYINDFGLEADRVPFREGYLQLNGGDFALAPLQPETFIPVGREFFPLRGIGSVFSSDQSQWSLFAGKAKYAQYLLQSPESEPFLFGGKYLVRRRKNYWGASLTGIANAGFVEASKAGNPGAVVSGDFIREISPWAYAFAQLSTSQDGSMGGRAGTQLQFLRGAFS